MVALTVNVPTGMRAGVLTEQVGGWSCGCATSSSIVLTSGLSAPKHADYLSAKTDEQELVLLGDQ